MDFGAIFANALKVGLLFLSFYIIIEWITYSLAIKIVHLAKKEFLNHITLNITKEPEIFNPNKGNEPDIELEKAYIKKKK